LEVTIGFLEEALKASLEAVLDANPIRYESTIDDAPKSDVTVIADGNRSATSRQLGIQRPNISQAIHGLALQLLEDEAGLSRRDKETLQGYMWSLKAGRHISMAVEIEEVDLRLYKQMCQHAGREGAASYLEDLAKQAMPVMETAHLVRVDPVDSVMRAALEVDMLRGKEWTWVVGDALATPCPTSGQGLVLPTEHLPMVYFTLLNARERDGRFPFIRALFQVMQRSLQVAQARAGFAMRELVELSGTQLIELLLVFGTGHDKGAKKVVRRRSIRDLRRIFKKDA
jgi:2-polyprenyl-6-methoxyphenol hydroxylase-like FAD-dependent oxidoreductase